MSADRESGREPDRQSVPAVVGVDGGNSKTDVVIADLHGRVLAEVRGPGTVPHTAGVPATAALVAGLVREARRLAGLDDAVPLAAGAFHWANLDVPHMERSAHEALRDLGLVARLSVRNDTFAVLKAGAPRGWGVAVVCGAGVNACAVAPDGRVERFLALGRVTGDVGGGADLAVSGIGAAVRAGDGRGPGTVLRDLLPPLFGRPDVERIAIDASEGILAWTDLLCATPVVCAAAQDGDPVALGLVLRQADELVTMVVALLRRIGAPEGRAGAEDVTVVLGGGTLQHGPRVLLDAVRDGLAAQAPWARPVVLDVRPVAGPLVEALELMGADEAARARVRAATALVPTGPVMPREAS